MEERNGGKVVRTDEYRMNKGLQVSFGLKKVAEVKKLVPAV